MRQPLEVDAYDLHHTLLNHIAILSTNAHLLTDSNLDTDQAEIVSDMVGSAKRAHELAAELGQVLGLHGESLAQTTERTRAS